MPNGQETRLPNGQETRLPNGQETRTPNGQETRTPNDRKRGRRMTGDQGGIQIKVILISNMVEKTS